MRLSISNVRIQEWGPLRALNLDLKQLNCIYGRNERGKTYLVEFLVKSLFKNSKRFSLRKSTGGGRVELTGLTENTVFSPGDSVYLDDFIEQTMEGLPADLSRLLVIKGAESGFSDAPGGISRATLQHYLSGRGILDQIGGRISKTLEKAEIREGEIIGDRRGEIVLRKELMEKDERVRELLERVDAIYSVSTRKTLIDAVSYTHLRAHET